MCMRVARSAEKHRGRGSIPTTGSGDVSVTDRLWFSVVFRTWQETMLLPLFFGDRHCGICQSRHDALNT